MGFALEVRWCRRLFRRLVCDYHLDQIREHFLQLRFSVGVLLIRGDHFFVTRFTGMCFQVHVREDCVRLRWIPHVAEVALARLMDTGRGI